MNDTQNPKSYLKKGMARNLPFHQAFVNEDWETTKTALVVVARKHKNGHITVGSYLLDLLCLGVKDTSYFVNIHQDEYQILLESHENYGLALQEISYELAHNIVYAAYEFAKENGISQHADFAYSALILAEDNEDVELMDIEVGEEGMPVLMINRSDPQMSRYIKQLDRKLGRDNYVMIDEFDDDEDELDEEDLQHLDFLDWSESQWYDFLLEFDDQQAGVNPMALSYVFDAMYYQKEEEKYLNENDSPYEPLTEDEISLQNDTLLQYTNEESLKEIQEFFKKHQSMLHPDSDEFVNMKNKYPNNPVLMTAEGIYYQKHNEGDKAIQIFGDIYSKFPDYHFAHFYLVRAYLFKKDFKKVEELMAGARNIKELYPNNKKYFIEDIFYYTELMVIYHSLKGNPYLSNLYYNQMRHYGDFSTFEDIENASLFCMLSISGFMIDEIKKWQKDKAILRKKAMEITELLSGSDD